MRFLVLKHDVAAMYKTYSEKSAVPGKTPIGRSMIYTIAKSITGGGKQQEARAGVDYIKINFHTDNFVNVDKITDVIAPLSDLRDELCGLHSWTTPYVMSCVVSAPTFTHSSVMAMQCM